MLWTVYHKYVFIFNLTLKKFDWRISEPDCRNANLKNIVEIKEYVFP